MAQGGISLLSKYMAGITPLRVSSAGWLLGGQEQRVIPLKNHQRVWCPYRAHVPLSKDERPQHIEACCSFWGDCLALSYAWRLTWWASLWLIVFCFFYLTRDPALAPYFSSCKKKKQWGKSEGLEWGMEKSRIEPTNTLHHRSFFPMLPDTSHPTLWSFFGQGYHVLWVT